jgi:DNA-binding response OmpR family regulator
MIPARAEIFMKKCIVVADDDPTIIHLVSLRLGMADFEVVSATSGEEALTIIRTRAPAMAILDVRMPGTSGIHVLRALKTDASTCDMPVMMLTGERDSETVMSAVGAGAADYLVKPFHPDRLMERVSRLVAARTHTSAGPVWEV